MWEPSGIERKDSCFLSPALESRRQRSNVAFMRTRTIVPRSSASRQTSWYVRWLSEELADPIITRDDNARRPTRLPGLRGEPPWVSTAHLTLGARERTSLS